MAKTDDKGFSKTDMERIGIFKEMGYISIGDKYKGDGQLEFNQAASKGHQLLPGGSKIRAATQAGYFSEKFDRVFGGESYNDPIKIRRTHRNNESKKNLGHAFLPSNGYKTMNGRGTYYGTLSGPISALAPNPRTGAAYKAPGKNFYTSPGKKGTGYGYIGVTMNQYPKYSPELYDGNINLRKKENELHRKMLKGDSFKLNMAPKALFEENPFRADRPIGPPKKKSDEKPIPVPFKPSSPAKRPGGNKSGTFDPYPNHSNDPYKRTNNRTVVNVVNKTGRTFVPNPGPKSAPVTSVVDQNVVKAINRQNFNTLNSIMSY